MSRGRKTGSLRGRSYHDVGIVFQGDDPLFVLAAFTDHVPAELPDGTPGQAAAASLIARLTRTCWDGLRRV